MADEGRREIPGPEKGGRREARLHLEVLTRMVFERVWDSGGPGLAEIWKLLPEDPREVTYEQILTVLEEIGVAPRDYYYELSRESWRRELEALCLRHLAARPRAPRSERPSGRRTT